MIINKFSKIFSRFLRGTMLSTVALTTASFGLSLYGPNAIIAPAHAAPKESQEQLEELKNYTPPPMFTSDTPADSDGDDESADELKTVPTPSPAPAPAPKPIAALPVPVPMTSSVSSPAPVPVVQPAPSPETEPPRVKIISTTNKTYDAIPRATITTLPAPALAEKSPEKSSEKIYDAPPKEWIDREEDRTAGMTRPQTSDAAQKEISNIKTSEQQTPALSAGKLPNILPEDILSHPTENNHVLTLRAEPEDALPLPSNPSKPAKISTPTKPDSPKNITSSAPLPAAAKTAPPEKVENPQISTAPPIPDHKPATLAKIAAKPTTKPTTQTAPETKTEPEAKTKSQTAPKIVTKKAPKPVKPDDSSPLQEPPTSIIKPADQRPDEISDKRPQLATSALDAFSLEFSPAATDLTADQRELLLQNVIKTLTQDPQLRVQILSYAGRVDGSESSARRISLSRALAVRSYLLENKIAPARIDVRALSDNTPETPADRMDLEFTK